MRCHVLLLLAIPISQPVIASCLGLQRIMISILQLDVNSEEMQVHVDEKGKVVVVDITLRATISRFLLIAH